MWQLHFVLQAMQKLPMLISHEDAVSVYIHSSIQTIFDPEEDAIIVCRGES